MKKTIYFLGYSKKKTSIINYLIKKKNIKLIHLQNKELTKNSAIKADLIICFGYRKLIKKNFLNLVRRPIINLHISYLPFNRGAHPNYWSFKENSPKGVTIHEIDKRIDMGYLVYRKKIIFKKKLSLTFKNTHNILINELEKIFIKNYKKIINGTYNKKKIKSKGTLHKSSQLPKNLKSWNVKISDYLKDYNKLFLNKG